MLDASELLASTPESFVCFLRDRSIRRFYFVWNRDTSMLESSHAELQPLADAVHWDCRDFLEHEGIFCQISSAHDTLLGAFIHRTVRGQGAGGVRYWHYDTVEAYLRDGLRLAIGMTRKNALAGLWWGGGKGVMAHNRAVDKKDPAIREQLFREYGELITSLCGCYVTAEDVGTHVADMRNVYRTTRFTTCVPEELGGSGNPSVPTARGVIAGMEAALEHTGEQGLSGKTVAVQGAGNVGGPLIGFLADRGVARILACDIDAAVLERARGLAAGVPIETFRVEEGDPSFFESECDIFAPCAIGAVLNPTTIPMLRARIVCGAANNQLEDAARDDRALFERGIVYVPDFLTNRMGIVNCADEQAGRIPNDPLFERHLTREWRHSIPRMSQEVLRRSAETKTPPAAVATAMADELSLEPHPIFGHRGHGIIRGLVADRWHQLAAPIKVDRHL